MYSSIWVHDGEHEKYVACRVGLFSLVVSVGTGECHPTLSCVAVRGGITANTEHSHWSLLLLAANCGLHQPWGVKLVIKGSVCVCVWSVLLLLIPVPHTCLFVHVLQVCWTFLVWIFIIIWISPNLTLWHWPCYPLHSSATTDSEVLLLKLLSVITCLHQVC